MDEGPNIMIHFLRFWWQAWYTIARLFVFGENVSSSIDCCIARTVEAKANGLLLGIAFANEVWDFNNFIWFFGILLWITLFHEIVYIINLKRIPITG